MSGLFHLSVTSDMTSDPLLQPLTLGGPARCPVTLRNRIALAPMAGLTDVPFRELAWDMGAGYVVSEMLASQPQLWDTGKSRLRRVPARGVQPVAVQIAGTEPEVMAAAARAHVAEGVQVVDINFGCPAKKVCRKAAGSALLQDIGRMAEIVSAVAAAVDVPVTVKTRTGLVPGDGRGAAAARAVAAAGAAMLVVHGRSRDCRFRGSADHSTAALIKQQVDIPVLVNGDVSSLEEARRALLLSGADGIMIGRGALGRPWLFRELTGGRPLNAADRWLVIINHVRAIHEFYGEPMGARICRKHVAAYLHNLRLQHITAGFHRLSGAAAQLAWLHHQARLRLCAA